MKRVQAASRTAWRAWLSKYHRTEAEVWCVFYKKHTGTPSVTYDDAVEEALCFGWIDTRVRRMDDDRYEQRFSPRKPGSVWSRSNVERMKKMIAARKVVAAGHAAFDGHEKRLAMPHPTRLPAALERSFRGSVKAWKNFKACPSGYQRLAIGWVASAKQDETRRRRLAQLIETSARGARLPFI